MSERPTPETDAVWADKSKNILEHARRLERERDEAREEWGKASMDAAKLLSEKTKVMAERDEARERAKELAELVDGAYIFVELDKPEGAYNKLWRGEWLEKAKRLIPGVDSIWY